MALKVISKKEWEDKYASNADWIELEYWTKDEIVTDTKGNVSNRYSSYLSTIIKRSGFDINESKELYLFDKQLNISFVIYKFDDHLKNWNNW